MWSFKMQNDSPTIPSSCQKNYKILQKSFQIIFFSESPRKTNTAASEEERRKILKMLVTPQAAKRTVSSASFDSMVIKAARSAENINSAHSTSNGLKGHSKDSIIRKESSSSLQIPGKYSQ